MLLVAYRYLRPGPRRSYERNYRRLEALMGRPLRDLRSDVVYRLRAEGFMDLIVEVLPQDRDTGAMVLSLAHYYEQRGDLCQDPEMTVRVSHPAEGRPGMVEALTFAQAVPAVYHAVYPRPGLIVPGLQRELNRFLATWLRNLKHQGHRPAPEGA
jgi:uncharacterized protein YqiB (DUF1249 family)